MNILFATTVSPFGESFGGQQRSQLLLQALARRGTVDVVVVRPEARDEVLASATPGERAIVHWRSKFGGLNKYVASTNLTHQLSTLLQRELAQYDLVVGRYLGSLSKLRLPPSVPSLVDLDDLAPTLWDGSLRPRAAIDLAKQSVHRLLDVAEAKKYTCSLFVSEHDKTRRQDIPGFVVPNIPTSIEALPDFTNKSSVILFVGSMWYRPNAEGINTFLASAWPQIRAQAPAAKLMIVGAAAPETRAQWESIPGVSAPGFVADLAATYRDAAFCISPVFTGGGSNIKVIEALAHGRTCVTTTHSHNGFRANLAHGRELLVAATPSDFSTHCVDLLRNHERRAALARAGHAVAIAKYSAERFHEAVDSAIDYCLSQQRPHT